MTDAYDPLELFEKAEKSMPEQSIIQRMSKIPGRVDSGVYDPLKIIRKDGSIIPPPPKIDEPSIGKDFIKPTLEAVPKIVATGLLEIPAVTAGLATHPMRMAKDISTSLGEVMPKTWSPDMSVEEKNVIIRKFKSAGMKGLAKAAEGTKKLMAAPVTVLLKTEAERKGFENVMKPMSWFFNNAARGWGALAELDVTGSLSKAAKVATGESEGSHIIVPILKAVGETAGMFALSGAIKGIRGSKWYKSLNRREKQYADATIESEVDERAEATKAEKTTEKKFKAESKKEFKAEAKKHTYREEVFTEKEPGPEREYTFAEKLRERERERRKNLSKESKKEQAEKVRNIRREWADKAKREELLRKHVGVDPAETMARAAEEAAREVKEKEVGAKEEAVPGEEVPGEEVGMPAVQEVPKQEGEGLVTQESLSKSLLREVMQERGIKRVPRITDEIPEAEILSTEMIERLEANKPGNSIPKLKDSGVPAIRKRTDEVVIDGKKVVKVPKVIKASETKTAVLSKVKAEKHRKHKAKINAIRTDANVSKVKSTAQKLVKTTKTVDLADYDKDKVEHFESRIKEIEPLEKPVKKERDTINKAALKAGGIIKRKKNFKSSGVYIATFGKEEVELSTAYNKKVAKWHVKYPGGKWEPAGESPSEFIPKIKERLIIPEEVVKILDYEGIVDGAKFYEEDAIEYLEAKYNKKAGEDFIRYKKLYTQNRQSKAFAKVVKEQNAIIDSLGATKIHKVLTKAQKDFVKPETLKRKVRELFINEVISGAEYVQAHAKLSKGDLTGVEEIIKTAEKEPTEIKIPDVVTKLVVEEIGGKVFESGKDTYKEWTDEMQKLLGNKWGKNKLSAKLFWDKVLKPITNQRGFVVIRQGDKIERYKRLGFNTSKLHVPVGFDKHLGIMSTRLKNIDPVFKYKLRKFELTNLLRIFRWEDGVIPMFVAAKKKMNKFDYNAFDIARKNSDVAILKVLTKKYNIGKEYNRYSATMREIEMFARKLGFRFKHVKNFHSRQVIKVSKYLDYLHGTDARSTIEFLIDKRNKKLVQEKKPLMTEDEKAIYIGQILRGVHGDRITLSKPGQLKMRTVENVTMKTNKFYAHSDSATLKYIRDISEALTAAELFGKGGGIKGRIPTPSESIGQVVLDLLQKREITPSQETQLTRMLNARFNRKTPSAVMRGFKDITYLTLMGDIFSGIQQIGDIAYAVYDTGPLQTIRSFKHVLSKTNVMEMRDYGLNTIGAEFIDKSVLSNLVDKTFVVNGVRGFDYLGKDILGDALYYTAVRRARNPKKYTKFVKELDEATLGLGKETLEDFKMERKTYGTLLYVFNKISDRQPITPLELTEMHAKGGNWSIMYVFKSFPLKRLDVFRTECFEQMKTKNTRLLGIRNLIHLTALLTLADATLDTVRDFLLGRPFDLSGTVISNLWQMAGATKFLLPAVKREGAGTALIHQLLPPAKVFDDVSRDIFNGPGEYGLRSVSDIPLAGRSISSRVGREKSLRDKKNKGLRGKSSYSGYSSAYSSKTTN